MKHAAITTLIVLGATCCLYSCQKAPELTLTGPASVDLSVDGGSGTISFTANRDWKVSCSDSWVTVSPSSGTASVGPVSVTVRCNANTTYEDRTATVTITIESISQTVSVKQPANQGVVIATQVYNVPFSANTIDVEVQANMQYAVTTDAAWIKQTGTKALASKTLTFSIEENKGYDAREGKISIKPQGDNLAEQIISVKQAKKDALIIKETSFSVPGAGGNLEINVEANVSFSVDPKESWIHFVETKALAPSTIILSVDANESSNKRSGSVIVRQANGELSETVTINQLSGVIPNNEIWYTTTDGKTVDPFIGRLDYDPDGSGYSTTTVGSFGPNLVSNTYNDGVGCLRFDGEVQRIGAAGFGGCRTLQSVTLPNSITSIEDRAFWQCTSLLSITIPENVERIGIDAFYHCISLAEVNLPKSLSSIDGFAFERCHGLKSFVFPSAVTNIKQFVLSRCDALESVVLPDTASSFEEGALYGCPSLKEIKSPFTAVDNRSIIINDVLVMAATGGLDKYSIPSSVKTIGTLALCRSRVKEISIPETVTSIGRSAISDCTELTSLSLPDSIIGISESAFSGCKGLTSVKWPNSITTLPRYVLNECTNLSTIVVPDNITSIEAGAFSKCTNLSSITLSKNLSSIGEMAFSECKNLKSVTIPDKVNTIGYAAFPLGKMDYVVMLPVNPPTLQPAPVSGGSGSPSWNFEGEYPIYVPAESVSSYKNAAGWYYYASRIHSIEEM